MSTSIKIVALVSLLAFGCNRYIHCFDHMHSYDDTSTEKIIKYTDGGDPPP